MALKIFGKLPKGKDLEKVSASSNFNGKSFDNPIPTKMGVKVYKVINDYLNTRSSRKPKSTLKIRALVKSDFQNPPAINLKLMWLGHASSLLELDGIRILTDPVFCKRVSPFSWMGPKRLHPTPFTLENIPDIDVVVISHNHYDHLDYEFIESIKSKQNVQFVCPLAVGSTLEQWGIQSENIHELDWHDSFEFKSVKFTGAPARHFTGRGLLDRNKSLWMSTIIEGNDQRVFFCGDSGFFQGFEEIGDKYGPFDFTMIGIGAYNEQWAAIHTNPEEAVEANRLLKGECLLPIHWGTFDLAPHPWDEPIERLISANEEANGKIVIPMIGEFISPQKAKNYEQEYWWR